MLDFFGVFTRGGFLLFSNGALDGNVLSRVIAEYLIEERVSSSECAMGSYLIKWRLDNKKDLVYIAASKSVLGLGTVLDLFLDDATKRFPQALEASGNSLEQPCAFDEGFLASLRKAEKKAEATKSQRGFESKVSGKGKEEEQEEEEENSNAAKQADDEEDETSSATVSLSSTQEDLKGSQDKEALSPPPASGPLSQEEIRRRVLGKSATSPGGKKKPGKASPPPKKQKELRNWGDQPAKPSKDASAKLAKSKEGDSDGADLPRGAARLDKSYKIEDVDVSSDEEDDEKGGAQAEEQQQQRGFFGNLFRNLTGRNLDEADLRPVIQELQEHLIKKNVASDVAANLCSSVQSSLLGKHLASLSSVSTHVKEALRVALVKILTPKRSVDILRDCQSANESGRPYTVVFVGINGVGKSTNLAKVAAWLLSNDKKVMIAACDTFRSGAVEQLAVHCRNLDVPLFQQGYGSDAATIAQYAIKQATKEGKDVVLIDTAGRMQDNEPLMQALAKLVAVNRPDLVLFVGEALAGNDSVDQLQKFNQALIDFSGSSNPRTVDGIMLSKFDTVDDQVGTAVSLVYSSGLPIVFLGTGQHYGDIKKLNVSAVVKALLK